MSTASNVQPLSRLARLRQFATGPAVDIQESLSKVSADLASSHLSGKLLVVIPGAKGEVWLVDLTRAGVIQLRSSRDAGHLPPEFIVFAKREELMSILRGELSPLEA